jgi:two-component system nitrogen regulation response regulator GlnG
MDVRMAGMSGLDAFAEIRRIEPRLPVIVMTAYGTTETAIEATRLGAFDYVPKPFEVPDILNLIGQALEAGRLMQQRVEINAALDDNSSDAALETAALIGKSHVMQELYKTIGRVAPTDATVLICGESGTGKELVARAVYQYSARSRNPFLVINCVAIPETLLESELFGYEKGAFTGADSRRVGKIERANGGTVFLDEVGDMPMSIQSKILRLLEERSIERLGGREPIPVDVRIIAATNQDLEAALQGGRFREDLYYRLKVVKIELPPLRDRKGDAPLLMDYFLARFSREMGMDNPGIAAEGMAACENHVWPGNVRELANVARKALIFSRGQSVSREEIAGAIAGNLTGRRDRSEEVEKEIRSWVRGSLLSSNENDLHARLMDRFASIVVSEALTLCDGNRSRAAKLLGISRPTLQAKIEKHHLKMGIRVGKE